MMRSKYSRFLVGGMVEPGVAHVPAYVFDGGNEWKLDTAIEWQNGLKASPDRQVCIDVFDIPEPMPANHMVVNEETGVEEEKETPEHYEWRMKRIFGERNIVYDNSNDLNDRITEVGYIYDVHYRCGLDVVLQIPYINFNRDMFSYETDYWYNADTDKYEDLHGVPANTVFTEIIVQPTTKFLHLNCSGTFQIPPPGQHYHITLTFTSDVGRGFRFRLQYIAAWVAAYNRMRLRYNNRRARLGLARWGGGYTYYMRDRTRVEGLNHPYNLIDDPDVRFVFNVPDKYKEGDGMHVSLLF